MNKIAMTLTFGGIMASALTSASVSADTNPFGMTAIPHSAVLAEADAGADKAKEAKCGADKAKEASCGAEKEKMAGHEKAKEGKCGEGKCGANKAKEGEAKE
jgi:uncharacterized low-complexity protein